MSIEIREAETGPLFVMITDPTIFSPPLTCSTISRSDRERSGVRIFGGDNPGDACVVSETIVSVELSKSAEFAGVFSAFNGSTKIMLMMRIAWRMVPGKDMHRY